MNIFGVVGWKNSGKTGLVERLVTEFTSRGVVVSTLKHAHHDFEIDQEGRDSFRHRAAGAKEVAILSEKRWAVMHELREADEPDPDEMLEKMADVDLILVEGFKNWKQPKILCHRAEAGDMNLIDLKPVAVASDSPIDNLMVPNFDLDDTVRIADFITYHLRM
ncbi:MAG: molybdopterin-guanine dinucleotide biosynthesis protein B [Pseudomonadota bacterium]